MPLLKAIHSGWLWFESADARGPGSTRLGVLRQHLATATDCIIISRMHLNLGNSYIQDGPAEQGGLLPGCPFDSG